MTVTITYLFVILIRFLDMSDLVFEFVDDPTVDLCSILSVVQTTGQATVGIASRLKLHVCLSQNL